MNDLNLNLFRNSRGIIIWEKDAVASYRELHGAVRWAVFMDKEFKAGWGVQPESTQEIHWLEDGETFLAGVHGSGDKSHPSVNQAFSLLVLKFHPSESTCVRFSISHPFIPFYIEILSQRSY